jgi:outer membrane protein assembly factor BamD
MYLKILRETLNLKIFIMVLLVLCLSGCSSLNIFGKKETVKNSPEALYARGAAEFQKSNYYHNYKKAREYFMRVKEEYPLHNLAILAEIGIADCHYSDKEYLEAENAYSDFVTLHPTNENVPYALYQIGMCNYNQMDAIDRDQTAATKAKKGLEKLVSRYPDSKFATMAEKLIRECKQKLAEAEFYVGQFYFKQKKYQAALARFETVARDYANVGLDYKVEYFINETKVKIAEEEKLKKAEEEKLKKAQQEKTRTAKNNTKP